jgi:rootletin
MDKAIKRLKNDMIEAENEGIHQKEELKMTLEAKHKAHVAKVTQEQVDQLTKLQNDLKSTAQELDFLRQSHTEEVIMTESSKQQALMMAQQEQKCLAERLEEVLSDLDETNQELDKSKRDGSCRIEKDRASIAELQLEVSKLRGLLQEKANQLEDDQKSLNTLLLKEKQSKINAETEADMLKASMRMANEKTANLQNELSEVKRNLQSVDNAKGQAQLELRDAEQRLEESRLQAERLDHIKTSLQEAVLLLEEEKTDLTRDLSEVKSKASQLEDTVFRVKHDLESSNGQYERLNNENADLEEQLQQWQSQYQDLQSEYRQLEVHYDSLKDRLSEEDEQRDHSGREAQNLRLKISELDGIKVVLEKELVTLKTSTTSDQEGYQQRISSLNQALEEMRGRERKLEDQRHNLEICLSNANKDVKDLNIKLTGQDGRMGELYTTIVRLESSKKEVESRLSSVATLIHHVRSSSSNSRSRPTTPTRTSRQTVRRSSSPWPPTSKNVNDEVDIDQVKSDVKDLIGKISHAEKERDEALHHVASLKRQNDELLVNTVGLEDQVAKQRKKALGTEEQLRKLEHKVSLSDASLGNQVRESLD